MGIQNCKSGISVRNEICYNPSHIQKIPQLTYLQKCNVIDPGLEAPPETAREEQNQEPETPNMALNDNIQNDSGQEPPDYQHVQLLRNKTMQGSEMYEPTHKLEYSVMDFKALADLSQSNIFRNRQESQISQNRINYNLDIKSTRNLRQSSRLKDLPIVEDNQDDYMDFDWAKQEQEYLKQQKAQYMRKQTK